MLLSLIFTACIKEEPYLTISKTQANVIPGQKTTVLVTSNNPWSAQGSDWCTVNPSSGKAGETTVEIVASENNQTEDRQCSIVFSSENITQKLDIFQPKGKVGISLPKNHYTITSDAQSIYVEVQSDIEYEISINVDWITHVGTKALDSKVYVFDISSNSSYDPREGLITIKEKGGNFFQTITVKQEQKNALIISKKEYEISSEEQSLEIKLQTNINIDIMIPDSAKTWVTHKETKALNDKSVILNINKNENTNSRSCKIILKKNDNSISDTIRITQAQKDTIIASQKEYEISSKEQSLEIKLQTNIDIDITIPDSAKTWISHLETKTLIDKSVILNINKNENTNSRSCKIILKKKNDSFSDTIKITQAQKDTIIVSQKEYKLSGTSQTIKVDILSNIDYNVNIPINAQDWLSLSDKLLNEENGNIKKETLVFAIKENLHGNRSTSIRIENKNGTNICSIIINQETTTINIHVQTPGGLMSALSEFDIDKIFSLTIKGALNDEDFVYIRSLPKLQILNLSDVNITSLPNSCFSDYKGSIESIYLPKALVSIGKKCFYNAKIKSIYLYNGIKRIDSNAFYGTNLASITIPASVETIGNLAFDYCTALTSVLFEENSNLKIIDAQAFSFCKNLASITIPASVETIGNSAFKNCTALTSVLFEENSNLKIIDEAAFSYCENIASITIPASVETIGNSAFYHCDTLTSVLFEENSNLKIIDESAFSSCEKIASITIPASVETIGNSAFKNCTALTSVRFENNSNLESFARSVFHNTNLYTIDMSSCTKIKDINGMVFYGCSNLSLMKLGAINPPTIDYNTFGKISSNAVLKVPTQSVEAYKASGFSSHFPQISSLED